MKNCYHFDSQETGSCPTCKADVVVTTVWATTIALGSDPDGAGSITTPTRPTAREALAALLGTAVEAIVIEDASLVPGRYGYGQATQVRWSLAGSRVRVNATLESSERVQRTPERVEYDPEEVVA